MNLDVAATLADAVLLEGYALYPYRASAPKNQFRWTFGVLAPRAWSDAGGCEPWWLEAQVLVAGAAPVITSRLRFFQVEQRRLFDRSGREVSLLEQDGELALPWDEGVLRAVDLDVPLSIGEQMFTFESAWDVWEHGGGTVRRERAQIAGRIAMRRERMEADRPLTRVTIRVENITPWTDLEASRERVMLAAFASTHLLVGVHEGELISAIDPPAWAVDAVAASKNVGTFPVLVGRPGSRDLMIAAPFIMYDHPQVAPESAGDLCDATEIDELLMLRTRILTDDEKRHARATDARTAAIVNRAETLPSDALERMHGATRDLDGGEMVPRSPILPIGSKVRLRAPARRTDAQDLLYAGHVATVAAIRHDVDGTVFLGVTVDDDPAAELHGWFGRFHYYRLDEVDAL